MFEIRVPKGKRFLLGDIEDEAEVILAPRIQLRVVSSEQREGGLRVVRAEATLHPVLDRGNE